MKFGLLGSTVPATDQCKVLAGQSSSLDSKSEDEVWQSSVQLRINNQQWTEQVNCVGAFVPFQIILQS